MKKKKGFFGNMKKGYSGSVKCNICGKVLSGNNIGAMCEQCYKEKIATPKSPPVTSTSQ